MCVCEFTCSHFSILCRRSIRNDTFDLQELVRLVTPNDSESESHVAFLQRCRQEAPLQLRGVPREQRLLCRGEEMGDNSKNHNLVLPTEEIQKRVFGKPLRTH